MSECRICGNKENNRFHTLREMMFGVRDEFTYIECAACGTIGIEEAPDMSPYYSGGYYSFSPADDLWFTKTLKGRFAAKCAGRYFVYGKNLIGKYLAENKGWINYFYPASLKDKILEIDFDSKILDFGCGSGKLLQALHYFGFRQLEGADAFIEKDIEYESGVKIYKKPLEQFDSGYDLIMLHHSFEHLPDPKETLCQLFRLVKPGRFCLVRIPVVNFAWEKYGTNWVQLDPPRHLFLFSESAFRNIAEKAGFEVAKTVYDSEAFQFWGSEQYMQDIPIIDERAYKGVISESIFSEEQMAEWEKETAELNRSKRGDQACFYLKKV